MILHFRRNLVAAAVVLMGCGAAENSGQPILSSSAASPGIDGPAPRMAIVNYTQMDFSEPEALSDYARAEMIVTSTAGLWCSRRNDGKLAEMKAINPDLKVIGYTNAHGSWLMWGDAPDRESSDNTYGWDWFQATKPYWSYTTTGDTMMSWPGKVLLNVLDPACRAAMVGVIADHWYAHPNVIDGVFWDHFNTYLWVPNVLPGVEGGMDLDGDGITHRDDEDEMLAYRQASASLICELRSALGDGVIQIANGGRAARDSVFAALVDGMMYENFPEVGFRQGNMRLVVDLAQSNNLFAARTWPRRDNGGPWLILSNKYRTFFYDSESQPVEYRQAEFSRVVAAITGCLVTYHSADQSMSYGWPDVDFDLGYSADGIVFGSSCVERRFRNGIVRLEFSDDTGPFPFDFEITQGDEVVQMFAYPNHFP